MRGVVRLPIGIVILLVVPMIAGCIDAENGASEGTVLPLTSLDVYEYRYAGDEVVFPGIAYGWMARIHNPTALHVAFVVSPVHTNLTTYGPAANTSWMALDGTTVDVLAPDEAKVYLFQAVFAEKTNETGFHVAVIGRDEIPADLQADAPALENGSFLRTLDHRTSDLRIVSAGHHVQTATVGVWLNGTSFYTNIPDLNADEGFPAGYDRADFGGDPLPVYVYDKDRSEQPPGSKDTCHYTTISGYNALLKTQGGLTTGVRWLAPEEAYTRPGSEDHDLYGDVLIFMNTVVQHDGAAGPASRAPDPQGACFKPENTSPVPLPPPPVR